MRIGKPNLINSRLFPELLIRSRSLGFSAGALLGPGSASPALGPWFGGDEFVCCNRKTNQT